MIDLCCFVAGRLLGRLVFQCSWVAKVSNNNIFFCSPEIDIISLYAQIILFLGNGLLPVCGSDRLG